MQKVAIAITGAVLAITGFFAARVLTPDSLFSGVGGPTGVSVTASSTAYALTTTSQRLMATSSKRVAATIDNINCTAVGTAFVSDNKDAAAVSNTGIAILASTTRSFGEGTASTLSANSITGIVNVGTCTVLVTEWRTDF